MPLHLIKLCVGCYSVADLEDWIQQKLKEKKKRGQKPEHIHTTRMVPKRADELTAGGSLYWVIRGQITCRERILAIRPFTDKDGVGRCRVVLDGKAVLVERARARPSRAGAISRPRTPRAIFRAPPPAPPKCLSRCGANCASWGCSRPPNYRSAASCRSWRRPAAGSARPYAKQWAQASARGALPGNRAQSRRGRSRLGHDRKPVPSPCRMRAALALSTR